MNASISADLMRQFGQMASLMACTRFVENGSGEACAADSRAVSRPRPRPTVLSPAPGLCWNTLLA